MKQGAEKINPYNISDSKTEQVENMFDSIAPAYDFMNTAMTFGLHKYWRNRALAMLKSENKQVNDILDVATGTGDVAFQLDKIFTPRQITGVDLSEGMLAIARQKLASMPAASRQKIVFEAGNCLDLKYADSSFDLITVAYGVRNFEQLECGYAEMLRVLRPGGRLCVIELSVPENKILKFFYHLYADKLIPAIGRLVSGDSHAYKYLPQSIAACLSRNEMTNLMTRIGFTDTKFISLTFGVVCIYIAWKPE